MACLLRPVASDVRARVCLGDSRTRDSPDAVGFFHAADDNCTKFALDGGGGQFRTIRISFSF